MTTKVVLVNYGPDAVLVGTFTKDNVGVRDMHCTKVDEIAPGGFREFYVHTNQGLLIDEHHDAPPGGQ